MIDEMKQDAILESLQQIADEMKKQTEIQKNIAENVFLSAHYQVGEQAKHPIPSCNVATVSS